jgi:hypothetical protein
MNNNFPPQHKHNDQSHNSQVMCRRHSNKKARILDEAPQSAANTTLRDSCRHSDNYGDIQSE